MLHVHLIPGFLGTLESSSRCHYLILRHTYWHPQSFDQTASKLAGLWNVCLRNLGQEEQHVRQRWKVLSWKYPYIYIYMYAEKMTSSGTRAIDHESWVSLALHIPHSLQPCGEVWLAYMAPISDFHCGQVTCLKNVGCIVFEIHLPRSFLIFHVFHVLIWDPPQSIPCKMETSIPCKMP